MSAQMRRREFITPPHVWMAPARQEIFRACSAEVGCSSLLMQSGIDRWP
jgi:hypothetical protein